MFLLNCLGIKTRGTIDADEQTTDSQTACVSVQQQRHTHNEVKHASDTVTHFYKQMILLLFCVSVCTRSWMYALTHGPPCADITMNTDARECISVHINPVYMTHTYKYIEHLHP